MQQNGLNRVTIDIDFQLCSVFTPKKLVKSLYIYTQTF